MTSHGQGTGWVVLEVALAAGLLMAAAGYAAMLVATRRRGRWPLRRTTCWFLGLLCVGVAGIGPVADAARTGFTAHMTGHLLLGMVGPLLLVRAAPVTLLLRALPVGRARRVSALLRTRPVAVVSHPVVAGALNAGGLWVLYASGLYGLMHQSVGVHVAVHLHVLVTGYLFTASVVGVDPDPHRATVTVRAVALVLFVAAHSVLATWLYAHPPTGTAVDDARAGAQLMYYGGDVVDVVLMVLLLAGWYRSTAPPVAPDRRPDRHRLRHRPTFQP